MGQAQPVRELALARREPWRDGEFRTHLLVLVLVEAVFGLFMVGFLVTGAVNYRGAIVSALIIFGGLFAWAAWPRLRGAWVRAPRLLVDEHHVTVDAPAVLKQPLVIPAREIRAVCIDATGDAHDQGGVIGRFPIRRSVSPWAPPVPDPNAELLGYLYASNNGSVVPTMGRHDERPNLALILEHPVQLPALRRMSSVAFLGYAPHGPAEDGTSIPGLLLRLDDPLQAATAFAPHRPRDLTDRDLRDIRPVAPLVKRFRRKMAWIKLGVTALLAYRVMIVLHFIGHPPH